MAQRTSVYSDVDITLAQQNDGDIQKDTEIEAIKNSIGNILATLQQSRRMLQEFPGPMHDLLFEPMDRETARLIGERILEQVNVWDDRVEVTGINIQPSYDSNKYICRLNFSIISTVQGIVDDEIKFVLSAK